ncbi:hypothetical protein Scep_017077 [Stephania cephalantha]|uniref:Uncharacterized protein n=1 Tax=Stephania cephalantha TaxID=152367 RepID=A0AAP0INX0_9MAGN
MAVPNELIWLVRLRSMVVWQTCETRETLCEASQPTFCCAIDQRWGQSFNLLTRLVMGLATTLALVFGRDYSRLIGNILASVLIVYGTLRVGACRWRVRNPVLTSRILNSFLAQHKCLARNNDTSPLFS